MAILDNVKEVARLAQEVGKLDLHRQAVELLAQITDLATENFELKQQITDLKKKLETKGAVIYNPKTHSYRLDGKGVYCATCYDQHGALQRLYATPVTGAGIGPDQLAVLFSCQRCKWTSGKWTRITKEELEWA